MKKVVLSMIGLFLLVFALSGISSGWLGRLGGMGDPFGLVADESDYLIHPAKIAKGEGVKFYGDYRFTYTGVSDWDFNYSGQTGTYTQSGGAALLVWNSIANTEYDFDATGRVHKHGALLGAAFPLGPGRMGLFFEYAGKRGDYEGDDNAWNSTYSLDSDLDNFALRFLYGLPVGSFNLGGEVQCAYRQEENKTWWSALHVYNYFGFGNSLLVPNIMPFMTPYDSKYWEALFKGSLEGKVGPLDLEFTLRGGFLFGGDNKLAYALALPAAESLNLKGDVSGWRIGGDLWLRYPLKDGLSLPFLVRIDYQEKTRDGDGQGAANLAGIDFNYKHEEKPFQIEVGGGFDKQLASSTQIAVGLYYNYLQGADEIKVDRSDYIDSITYNDYPASSEHRIVARLAGEHEFSPAVTLRLGLNGFYGWMREDYEYCFNGLGGAPANFDNENSTLNGSHWGIGASLGGTIKFKPITVEPFINGGWQQIKLDGDVERIIGGRRGVLGPVQSLTPFVRDFSGRRFPRLFCCITLPSFFGTQNQGTF
jgi:hypothetical protein